MPARRRGRAARASAARPRAVGRRGGAGTRCRSHAAGPGLRTASRGPGRGCRRAGRGRRRARRPSDAVRHRDALAREHREASARCPCARQRTRVRLVVDDQDGARRHHPRRGAGRQRRLVGVDDRRPGRRRTRRPVYSRRGWVRDSIRPLPSAPMRAAPPAENVASQMRVGEPGRRRVERCPRPWSAPRRAARAAASPCARRRSRGGARRPARTARRTRACRRTRCRARTGRRRAADSTAASSATRTGASSGRVTMPVASTMRDVAPRPARAARTGTAGRPRRDGSGAARPRRCRSRAPRRARTGRSRCGSARPRRRVVEQPGEEPESWAGHSRAAFPR